MACLSPERYISCFSLFRNCWKHVEHPEPQVPVNILLAALKACSCLRELSVGRRIHSDAISLGYESDLYVSTTLVDMYSNCGSLGEARGAFEKMPHRNVVAWTALILGYADNQEGETGLDLFSSMQSQNLLPGPRTFVAAIKSCTSLARGANGNQVVKAETLLRGKAIHHQADVSRVAADLFVSTSLIVMYSVCGSIEDAWSVFSKMPCHNTVAWNALLSGYAENQQEDLCLKLFDCVPEPNARTILAALKACTDLDRGKALHALVLDAGFLDDIYLTNTLVHMYTRCGSLTDAREVFDRMTHRTVVSWNALMLGFIDRNQGDEAIQLFLRMDCEPDVTSFATALKACSRTADLSLGKAIHEQVSRRGMETSSVVATALIDCYAKAGCMNAARLVFDSIPSRATGVTWSALIAGHSRRGEIRCVLHLLGQMREQGVELDEITFVSALSACAHAGLLEEGGKLLREMQLEHSLNPSIEHYHCLIDSLGRADCNRLDAAFELKKSMPYSPNAVTWTTLLAACSRWDNVKLGELAFRSLLQIDHNDVVACKLMAKIYTANQMWEEQDDVLNIMNRVLHAS